MDKAALKKYAPQARKDSIAAVARRADTLGLNPDNPGTVEQNGDAMLINGQPFPADLKKQRDSLKQRIAEQGFDTVMDAIAYTWFNRLVAIRYMELHDFLGHGYRVLSHPQNHSQPEILDHIDTADLLGLNRQHALDLKLAGNRDEELYREVLLAQCHALHTAMPFLFESIDDATELLLPDGLLRTDSLIRELVSAIDEVSWQHVEIIGWLYQFYISEKKDQVIGKVVKSEDIPAATQLFTPNWIVKYLVQNSLGRLWLMANPTSTLASQWDYYIQPAEQTPEVNAQLDELIQTRIAEDGTTLNPESLTLLDPACGSGHILVEAYDLLRDIYLERGYRQRDIPRLILEKNLYGLDIDERAAQLSGFALLMKARADDRRLFRTPVELNVRSLAQPAAKAAELYSALNDDRVGAKTINLLVETFAPAKTLGSLLQIPSELAQTLPTLREQLKAVADSGDLFAQDAANDLLALVSQAQALAGQYDAVVANPPYMGSKGMNAELKEWGKGNFPESKADLFAMFIERGFCWCKVTGFNSMVTMHSWLFLSRFENMRGRLLDSRTINTLAHLGARAFSEISGEVVQTVAFILHARRIVSFRPIFFRLVEGTEAIKDETLRKKQNGVCAITQDALKEIPGSPLAYWASADEIRLFSSGLPVSSKYEKRLGLCTGNNERFLRFWHEIDYSQIDFSATSCDDFLAKGKLYAPHNKGGVKNKWAGNQDYVIKFDQRHYDALAQSCNRLASKSHYFRECLTWSEIGSNEFAVRVLPSGYTHNIKGPVIFSNAEDKYELCGYLNSSTFSRLLNFVSQTMSINGGDVVKVPLVELSSDESKSVSDAARQCHKIAQASLSGDETCWSFHRPIWFAGQENIERPALIKCSYSEYLKKMAFFERATVECGNLIDRIYAQKVGLDDVTRNVDHYYDDDIEFRKNFILDLISFSLACMMGRYSLDTPGLIYAHADNEGFDPGQYKTFPADADGIVPITDEDWFKDDGTNRIREFVRAVWRKATEAENMAWLAESIGTKSGESPDDTIRRYLSKQFYKDKATSIL